MILLFALALAATPTCPSVDVTPHATTYDTERAWMHKRGWFEPLTDPEVQPVTEASYPDDEAMLVVTTAGGTRAYPVRAMAQHHVANDSIGGVPVTLTY